MREAVPSPDLFLARRAAAGHEEAWGELVDRYGARIFNLALHFAGSREDAEDLTQEVFVRLHRGLRTYRGEVPLIAWALRLSRNLCIDHYRSVRKERETIDRDVNAAAASSSDHPWRSQKRTASAYSSGRSVRAA